MGTSFHSTGSGESGHATISGRVDHEFHDRVLTFRRATWITVGLPKQAPVPQGIAKSVATKSQALMQRFVFARENCVRTDDDRRHVDWG